MRYTEARMTPLALEMLRDIEKDTVPFRLNFDDTLKEPDMLPARFPNLLVNGATDSLTDIVHMIRMFPERTAHSLRVDRMAVIAIYHASASIEDFL